ncbi:MAG TPA: diaminopimelate decarboxylase [Gemmatimonadales bacterium]|nr:diaminopimelate decarboxylase [Gemmatimonadales bacterium]
MGQGILSSERAALLEDAGLVRRDGALVLDGVPLAEIAATVGTPTYVYSAAVIRRRYAELDAALAPVPHRIAFAVKANSSLAVLRVFRELGAGADIVSGGEMRRALAAGFPAERIVFSGVGKTEPELDAAVAAGVGHVHLESTTELDALAAVAARHRRTVRVGIRVNPDITADTHPYISTGQGGIKFGVPFDQVVPLAREVADAEWLELDTIAMHLGSQLLNPAPYQQGIARLLALLAELERAGIDSVSSLDIGGGLGIRYRSETPLTPADLAAAVLPQLAASGKTVVMEPGRYLTGPAGVLLTTVLARKHSGGKEFVIVDAGMNDLVRPSHYHAYHDIVEVEAAGRPERTADVVGPVCETGDFLALDRPLPVVEGGEHLAVLGAGAYGFVMSSNYNSRPRAAEVMVDGDSYSIARRRETFDDLIRGEK